MGKRSIKEWIVRSVILLVGPVAGIFLPINGKMVLRILKKFGMAS